MGGGEMIVCSGVIAFPRHHAFLYLLLEQLRLRYDPTEWACIGPYLVTAVIRDFTGLHSILGSTPIRKLQQFISFFCCYFSKIDAFFRNSKVIGSYSHRLAGFYYGPHL